jgi:hypothetical protein
MELADLEREEFIALANETFDPELWLEDEVPDSESGQSGIRKGAGSRTQSRWASSPGARPSNARKRTAAHRCDSTRTSGLVSGGVCHDLRERVGEAKGR